MRAGRMIARAAFDGLRTARAAFVLMMALLWIMARAVLVWMMARAIEYRTCGVQRALWLAAVACVAHHSLSLSVCLSLSLSLSLSLCVCVCVA